MTKNFKGGSGHKAQRNSEAPKARKNRGLVDDLLDDLTNGKDISGVFVGKITRRIGHGQMEVFFVEEKSVNGQLLTYDRQQIMPMAGSLTGKGKSSVWVDIGSFVRVDSTGLSRVTHEIVAVFTEDQIRRLRKLDVVDERMFAKGGEIGEEEPDIVFETAEGNDEIKFEEPEEQPKPKQKFKRSEQRNTFTKEEDDDEVNDEVPDIDAI